MEHKLILGGEIYLPFARSRIKALRATGLEYASQSFEMGDASVKVRIMPGHEYIRLEGGTIDVLSGCVKKGELITVPSPTPDTPPSLTLRSYKPTQQALQYPLKKDVAKTPPAFRDEARLAVSAHANLAFGGSQYDKLCASMYSGTMAKVVQVILGYGKPKKSLKIEGQSKADADAQKINGIQVKYAYQWTRCHGIVRGEDGKQWLVEISNTNGVIAMLLPLLKGTAGFKSSKQDVLREAAKLLGGLPSGETFPSDIALAINEGTVIRLKTASDMQEYFSRLAYNADLGWSFNNTGSEAHNTCYGVVDQIHTGFHYKLAITIGAVAKNREENQPIAVGSATLTVVSSGRLTRLQGFSVPFAFASAPSPFSTYLMERPPVTLMTSLPNTATSVPIFVCHIAGVLEVLRIEWRVAADTSNSQSGAVCSLVNNNNWTFSSLAGNSTGFYISSTKYPGTPEKTSRTITRTFSEIQRRLRGKQQRFLDILVEVTSDINDASDSPSAAAWPSGARDSYVFYTGGGTVGVGQQKVYEIVFPVAKADYRQTGSRQENGIWYVTYERFETSGTTSAGCPTGLWDFNFPTGEMTLDAYNALPSFEDPPLVAPPSIETIPMTRTYPKDQAKLVCASGDVHVMGSYETDIDFAAANEYWRTISGRPNIFARSSVFGSRPHAVFSTPLPPVSGARSDGTPSGLRTVGTMLASEVSVPGDNYSFTGYI